LIFTPSSSRTSIKSSSFKLLKSREFYTRRAFGVSVLSAQINKISTTTNDANGIWPSSKADCVALTQQCSSHCSAMSHFSTRWDRISPIALTDAGLDFIVQRRTT
jgi:hypothetical protein